MILGRSTVRRYVNSSSFCFLLLASSQSLFAQVDEGSISGAVQDPTGAVIPSAQVTLLNTDRDRAVSFKRGDRIAQLVIQRVDRAVFHEVDVLPGSRRGDGGFGSTGGHNGERTELVS